MDKITFRDLKPGDTFDFIDDTRQRFNSYFERCKKISAGSYAPLSGAAPLRIGSTKARVYHVKREAL